MKKLLLIGMLVVAIHGAFAQTDTNKMSQQQYPAPMQGSNQWDWNWDNKNVVEPSRVPPDVSSPFNKRYPDQKDVTWYQTDKGYVATYADEYRMNQRILYDKNGMVIGNAKQVKGSALPTTTTEYIKKTYPGVNYKDIYQVTSNGTTMYVVSVNGKWMTFDSNGNLIPPAGTNK